MEGLIRRLVDFSRPLAPRVEVATVATLLDGALEAAQPVLKRHAVTVERRQEPDLLPIEVDPLLFTQVLVNLLANAAEAMAPAGGRVSSARGRRACSAGTRSRSVSATTAGDLGGAARRAVQALLHHQAQRPRPGAGGQPEHSARARRAHRGRESPARRRNRRRLRSAAASDEMSVQVLIAGTQRSADDSLCASRGHGRH